MTILTAYSTNFSIVGMFSINYDHSYEYLLPISKMTIFVKTKLLMLKIQLKSEVDFSTFINQLNTNELEEALKEISDLLSYRKTKDKKVEERELLKYLNEECVLSPTHWAKFWELTDKQKSGTLTAAEQQTLATLIQEEEQLRLKRIKILGKIAQIRGVSLEKVAVDLGIKTPEDA